MPKAPQRHRITIARTARWYLLPTRREITRSTGTGRRIPIPHEGEPCRLCLSELSAGIHLAFQVHEPRCVFRSPTVECEEHGAIERDLPLLTIMSPRENDRIGALSVFQSEAAHLARSLNSRERADVEGIKPRPDAA